MAWEHLGADVGEWTVPGVGLKVKFILFIDLATKYRVVEVLSTYKHGQTFVETGEDIIRLLTTRWLMDKPRPRVFIPAKSLTSKKFMEVLSDLAIAAIPPIDQPSQDPIYSLAMACAAINSTEFDKGYTIVFNGPMASKLSWMMINFVNNFHFLENVNKMNFFVSSALVDLLKMVPELLRLD